MEKGQADKQWSTTHYTKIVKDCATQTPLKTQVFPKGSCSTCDANGVTPVNNYICHE